MHNHIHWNLLAFTSDFGIELQKSASITWQVFVTFNFSLFVILSTAISFTEYRRQIVFITDIFYRTFISLHNVIFFFPFCCIIDNYWLRILIMLNSKGSLRSRQAILIVTVLYLMVTVRIYTVEFSAVMSTKEKLISLTKSQSVKLYETRKNVLNLLCTSAFIKTYCFALFKMLLLLWV